LKENKAPPGKKSEVGLKEIGIIGIITMRMKGKDRNYYN